MNSTSNSLGKKEIKGNLNVKPLHFFHFQCILEKEIRVISYVQEENSNL